MRNALPFVGLWVGSILLAGCDASAGTAQNETVSGESQSQAADSESQAGFTGEVTGAIAGPISGPGVLNYLADEDSPDGRGYSYLADDDGIRDFGITFSLPDEIGVGRFTVTNPDPFGESPEVSARIDQDTGTATVSWQNSVSGELVLEEFPDFLEGGQVKGTYSIMATNGEGEPVTSTGNFDFSYDPRS